MPYDSAVCGMIRQAVADGRDDLLYAMVPADDGGQSYEMKCKICGELDNILASRFRHADDDCPVVDAEKRLREQAATRR
jgi:hypothetical protein